VNAIDVEDLTLHIAGHAILNDVSFSVGAGEWFSIIGPNGAGKTTLLKCLNRIHRAFTGSVRVNGELQADLSQRELARRIAYVPQADARHFGFTAREFVLLARYPHLSPFTSIQQADRDATDEGLRAMGCEAFADRSMATLSGGERQKVILAAAIAQGASILLLDEPTTFLDYRHQVEIRAHLRALHTLRRITIIAVTHDVSHAVTESDRILALRDGRVVFCDTSTRLLDGETLEMVFDTAFERVPSSTGLVLIPRESGP
jgi:iron complex transport system ATP-binding protein